MSEYLTSVVVAVAIALAALAMGNSMRKNKPK
jgi:hypothetical protein